MSSDDFGLPRMHSRETVVREAELKLKRALLEAIKDLTEAEGLRVVNAVMSSHIGSVAKYAIREERHGDPEKPGGLA